MPSCNFLFRRSFKLRIWGRELEKQRSHPALLESVHLALSCYCCEQDWLRGLISSHGLLSSFYRILGGWVEFWAWIGHLDPRSSHCSLVDKGSLGSPRHILVWAKVFWVTLAYTWPTGNSWAEANLGIWMDLLCKVQLRRVRPRDVPGQDWYQENPRGIVQEE